MADAPQPAPIVPPVPDNIERVVSFLRQENDAHRQALREDSKANRDLLIGAIRLVSIPVAAAILVIGWFGLKSFSDLKEQLRDSAAEQLKTETARMQSEIRERLDKQFQTANLQQTVRDAARDATQAAAAPLIRREVTQQVQSHIRAEVPEIHSAVLRETQKGVSALQPTIDSEITKQANAAESRIQAQIAPYGDVIRASKLAALARNGVGTAFDDLMKMSDSPNRDIQDLVISTHNAIFMEYEQAHTISYIPRIFQPQKKSKEELLPLLSDPQPLTRKAAIDGLSDLGDKSVVPQLLVLMRHDLFMFVRQACFHALIHLTGQNFNPLDTPGWEAWWEKNKDNWPPKS